MKFKKISVAIPVYNEEGNLIELYTRLSKVMNKIGVDYEIIFTDDGSKDNSFSILEEIYKRDMHVKVIKHRKNFGECAATVSGLKYSSGDVIVTMDGDLQNHPEDIPGLLKKIEDGYDVVSGWRFDRIDPLEKRIFSKIANSFRRFLIKEDIHDSGCSLKAYRKEAVENLNLYGDMHRYITAIISQYGFRIGEVKVRHSERKHGKSKYNAKRIFKGFLDLFYVKFWLDYSRRPLHFFGFIGGILILVGLVLGIIKTITTILYYLRFGEADIGPLLLASIFLVIIGILFIMFGFLAEIQIRIYYDARKNYEIEKILER
ncbi:glycosyltransferase family 2 protein [Candidatus Woesearchaeota archaeon]|nr:glycosyltransferase family 2 protein [Candidatus Woesearchaeota archaeon]